MTRTSCPGLPTCFLCQKLLRLAEFCAIVCFALFKIDSRLIKSQQWLICCEHLFFLFFFFLARKYNRLVLQKHLSWECSVYTLFRSEYCLNIQKTVQANTVGLHQVPQDTQPICGVRDSFLKTACSPTAPSSCPERWVFESHSYGQPETKNNKSEQHLDDIVPCWVQL